MLRIRSSCLQDSCQLFLPSHYLTQSPVFARRPNRLLWLFLARRGPNWGLFYARPRLRFFRTSEPSSASLFLSAGYRPLTGRIDRFQVDRFVRSGQILKHHADLIQNVSFQLLPDRSRFAVQNTQALHLSEILRVEIFQCINEPFDTIPARNPMFAGKRSFLCGYNLKFTLPDYLHRVMTHLERTTNPAGRQLYRQDRYDQTIPIGISGKNTGSGEFLIPTPSNVLVVDQATRSAEWRL